MYKELFSKKLIKARKDAGYTQLQAAHLIQIPRATLANYEIGRTEPDIETLGMLADLYEVSIDWLLSTGNILKRTN